MDQVEARLAQITQSKGVLGCVVTTAMGTPVYDTFADDDRQRPVALALATSEFVESGREIVMNSGEPQHSLASVRIRTTLYELIIMPGAEYTIVVVQDPKIDMSRD